MLNQIKGIILMYLMYTGCFFGTMFFVGPYLCLIFVFPKVYRWLVDQTLGYWVVFTASLIEFLFGTKIYMSGDPFVLRERTLILLNHRTRLDWMFFWSCLARFCNPSNIKIALTSTLKPIPGPGWSMQAGVFFFLERRWEKDRVYLSKMLAYLASLDHRTQLLLFPEGTDITPYTKKDSDKFADKNNLPRYRYVLHPRTTGFVHMVQEMRRNGQIDAVHDVTVAYPANIPSTEVDIALGNMPREIHYLIKRYPIADLPVSEEGLAEWCQDLWLRKERVLERVYADKPHLHAHLRSKTPAPDNSPPAPTGAGDGSIEKIVDPQRAPSPMPVYMKFTVALWTLFVVLFHCVVWYSVTARYWILFCSVFFVIADRCYGGLELVQYRFSDAARR